MQALAIHLETLLFVLNYIKHMNCTIPRTKSNNLKIEILNCKKCKFTYPNIKKGNRNERPLVIQDWNPSVIKFNQF